MANTEIDRQSIVYFQSIGNRYSIFFETPITYRLLFQSIIDPWIMIDYLLIGKNYRFFRMVTVIVNIKLKTILNQEISMIYIIVQLLLV